MGFNFYRATLCVSAVFAVVCPSVTLVDCYHMAEDIVKLVVWPGSPITQVFWPPAPVPNSAVWYGILGFNVPPQFSGDAKYTEVGKVCYFRLKSTFISETVEIGPYGCYGMLTGSHRRRIDPCQLRWLWVTPKSNIPNISSGTMFGDLDWLLNASRGLPASTELLVWNGWTQPRDQSIFLYTNQHF